MYCGYKKEIQFEVINVVLFTSCIYTDINRPTDGHKHRRLNVIDEYRVISDKKIRRSCRAGITLHGEDET